MYNIGSAIHYYDYTKTFLKVDRVKRDSKMQELYDNVNLHLIPNVIGAILHQWSRMQEGGQKESHE